VAIGDKVGQRWNSKSLYKTIYSTRVKWKLNSFYRKVIKKCLNIIFNTTRSLKNFDVVVVEKWRCRLTLQLASACSSEAEEACRPERGRLVRQVKSNSISFSSVLFQQ